MKEVKKRFHDWDVDEQKYIVYAHCHALKRTRKVATMFRIFTLGNPETVIAYDNDGNVHHCRVDGETSVKVMNILILQYLT
jgi:hypothetical protein